MSSPELSVTMQEILKQDMYDSLSWQHTFQVKENTTNHRSFMSRVCPGKHPLN